MSRTRFDRDGKRETKRNEEKEKKMFVCGTFLWTTRREIVQRRFLAVWEAATIVFSILFGNTILAFKRRYLNNNDCANVVYFYL